MKTTLTNILKATLETFGIDEGSWEISSETVLPQMFVCFLASEVGFSHLEIGEFLKLSEDTVKKHIKEFKEQAGEKAIEEARAKLSKYTEPLM